MKLTAHPVGQPNPRQAVTVRRLFCLVLFAREKVVTMEFIKKYIHVAKLVKPVLSQEASDHIAEQYSRLRSHDQVNSESARVGTPTRSP